jgi:hypothetical protein
MTIEIPAFEINGTFDIYERQGNFTGQNKPARRITCLAFFVR